MIFLLPVVVILINKKDYREICYINHNHTLSFYIYRHFTYKIIIYLFEQPHMLDDFFKKHKKGLEDEFELSLKRRTEAYE
jgi:glycopeptide antibiotics resistance protein